MSDNNKTLKGINPNRDWTNNPYDVTLHGSDKEYGETKARRNESYAINKIEENEAREARSSDQRESRRARRK